MTRSPFGLLLLLGCGDAAPITAEDAGASDGDSGKRDLPQVGVLQFRARHNLVDDRCLANDSCRLTFEESTLALPAWLEKIGAHSGQAVLHYDRAIPWSVFARTPPGSQSPVTFYDGLLDADLSAYLASFERHFAAFDQRFLAVSILDGTRDRVVPERMADGTEVRTATACTELGPDSTLSFSPGEPPIVIESAYRNFVAYLAKKLKPTRLAILVEANLYRRICPRAWPSLVGLYHRLYDALRSELGPGVALFATLTWSDLLGFDGDRCMRFDFVPCDGAPPPSPAALDPDVCYPMDRQAIDDLNAGDRLDILALSFYPDALSMSAPGAAPQEIAVFSPTSDGQGTTCRAHALLPPMLDPFEPLGRLGWTKPMAIAETSGRSCPTLAWWVSPTETALVRLGASSTSQAYWLSRTLELLESGHFAFVNQSFLEDYPPLGPWLPRQEVMDPMLFNLINNWPCSGLLDEHGQPKPEVRARWPL